jgi:hypothetical protein
METWVTVLECTPALDGFSRSSELSSACSQRGRTGRWDDKCGEGAMSSTEFANENPRDGATEKDWWGRRCVCED